MTSFYKVQVFWQDHPNARDLSTIVMASTESGARIAALKKYGWSAVTHTGMVELLDNASHEARKEYGKYSTDWAAGTDYPRVHF